MLHFRVTATSPKPELDVHHKTEKNLDWLYPSGIFLGNKSVDKVLSVCKYDIYCANNSEKTLYAAKIG